MNISSTPFIRNDYWPDQNDINELNKRIDEAENETSIVNSRLSNDIENVSANLNSYISNQANTTIANNIIVNSLNANYATGKFANFTNTFTNNAYVENLTVNKPVFDITLNTPHIENVTSLGGNIYDANIFNVSITGGNVAFNSASIEDLTAENATISDVNIQSGHAILNTINVDTLKVNNPVSDITLNAPNIENVTSLGGNISDANILNANLVGGNAILNSVNTESLVAVNTAISNVNILDGDVNLNKAIINNVSASNATILNLFVNTEPGPITSSAVLGYDSDGRVIPIHAAYDVSFPENANYLFTDQYGTAIAGTAATAVGETDNLITSFAVKNALDIVNDSFNSVNNVFNDIGSWQNTFENSVANSFNNVNNTFNSVNSSIASSLNNVNNAFNNSFNNVNNKFNNVNNTFNNVNSYISGSINNVNNSFNNVNNTFNNVNNVISNVNNTSVNAATLAGSVSSSLVGNAVPYTSTSLMDYRGVTTIKFVTPARASYVSQMVITFPEYGYLFICQGLMYTAGSNDARTITLTRSGPHASFTASGTISLRKAYYNARGSLSFDNPIAYTPSISGNNLILTGSGVTLTIPLNSYILSISKTYANYPSISLPNTPAPVYIDFNTSNHTLEYSSNVIIDNNYNRIYNEDMGSIFDGCTSFNQPVNIPSYVTGISSIFSGCTSFNQPVTIPSGVTAIGSAFSGCTQFNKPVTIPSGVTDMSYTFSGCTKFNQPLNIPSSVSAIRAMLNGCTSFNQNDIYLHATLGRYPMDEAFKSVSRIGNIHIPASVPKATSNEMYNCLVNGATGHTFAAANVKNDL
jgi:hypothetical protein